MCILVNYHHFVKFLYRLMSNTLFLLEFDRIVASMQAEGLVILDAIRENGAQTLLAIKLLGDAIVQNTRASNTTPIAAGKRSTPPSIPLVPRPSSCSNPEAGVSPHPELAPSPAAAEDKQRASTPIQNFSKLASQKLAPLQVDSLSALVTGGRVRESPEAVHRPLPQFGDTEYVNRMNTWSLGKYSVQRSSEHVFCGSNCWSINRHH